VGRSSGGKHLGIVIVADGVVVGAASRPDEHGYPDLVNLPAGSEQIDVVQGRRQ
jgi:hypothetical protein